MSCKIQYFFNAIHYYIYLEERFFNKTIKKFINRIGSFLFESLLPSKYSECIINRCRSNFTQTKKYIYDDYNGFCVSTAHHVFGAFSAGYLSFFSFILIGYCDKYLSTINQMIAIIIIALPIAIGYIPIYRMVFQNDIYIDYFKQFKKEDNNWKRKWKKISIVYCLGSVFMEILGFCTMVIIRSA